LFHFALRGPLEVFALTQALHEILRRHHLLRTIYHRDGTRIWQQVQPVEAFKLEFIEGYHLSPNDLTAQAQALHQRHANAPFDLFHELPLRATLLHSSDARHHFILSMHHVLYDHVTSRALLQELWTLYESFVKTTPSPLPEPSLQYADFAAWESAWVRRGTPHFDSLATYWLQQLADAPRSPEGMLAATLPVSQPTLEDCIHPIDLTPESTAHVRQFAREEKATVFMVLLAAVKAVFQLGGGFNDIILTTFVDGRTRPELNDLFGCFSQGIPLRTSVTGSLTFSQVVQRVRSTCLQALTHQDLPADKIGETLRRNGRPPLDIRAAIQILEVTHALSGPTDLTVERLEFGPSFPISATDFYIQFTDDGEILSGKLYSGSGRMCPQRLRHFTKALTDLVSQAILQPSTQLQDFARLVAPLPPRQEI
jgi:hypothetical protein